ncbi:AHH domain-containing protein [Marinobacteraceae bacterium S3BR75-40.1]
MKPHDFPQAAPQRPADPTPLELAIHNYEVACVKYHNDKMSLECADISAEERRKRLLAQERDWKHLQQRKRALAVHAQLQSELEQYRAENSQKPPKELEKEAHHPTTKLTKHLFAVGEPQPSPKHAAHHIIMGKGRHRVQLMATARFNLHMYGIGINDPVNGVWLAHNRKNSEYWRVPESTSDKPKHWATPESPVHLTIHGKNYEQWIGRLFGDFNIPEHSFRNRLRDTKLKLRFGGYPAQIEEKYDATWSGKS